MKIPDKDCIVWCHCTAHPSEDPLLVERAVSAVLPGVEIAWDPGGAGSGSAGIDALRKVHDAVRSRRSERLYGRHLDSNLDGDSTWFYLNKQAALAGAVALCSEAGDSPLGPIKVEIRSHKILEVIQWLAPRSTKSRPNSSKPLPWRSKAHAMT